MLPLLAMPALASSLPPWETASADVFDDAALDADVFAWDWSRTHRYFIESRVQLPLVMWLTTPFNQQARIAGFDLRLVTTCDDARINTRRTVEVSCRLDDVALSAEGIDQDYKLLQPILTELDGMLTGSTVQLQIGRNGNISNVDLEGLDHRNRRTGQLIENLRLIVSRAFAGLDLQLPRTDEQQWAEYDSWLLRAPSINGSSGGAEIVHAAVTRDGRFASVASAGRSVIFVGEGLNKYDTRLTSEAKFDLRSGRLSDRTWTVVGGPTASSWIAFGAAGYPYVQEGRLVALTGDESWDVGESVALPATAHVPTAIQQAWTLGGAPDR